MIKMLGESCEWANVSSALHRHHVFFLADHIGDNSCQWNMLEEQTALATCFSLSLLCYFFFKMVDTLGHLGSLWIIHLKPCLPQTASLATEQQWSLRLGQDQMLVTQSCLTVCDPMDCSPSGISVHGILQARILEWGAISFSGGSSQPRDRNWVSCIARAGALCSSIWTWTGQNIC